MTVDHALTCPSGGYPTARHNEVRDLLANVMMDILRDFEIEPKLLLYQGEDLEGKTANRANEARLDIRAKGFWTRQQEAFFLYQGNTPQGQPAVIVTSPQPTP